MKRAKFVFIEIEMTKFFKGIALYINKILILISVLST